MVSVSGYVRAKFVFVVKVNVFNQLRPSVHYCMKLLPSLQLNGIKRMKDYQGKQQLCKQVK